MNDTHITLSIMKESFSSYNIVFGHCLTVVRYVGFKVKAFRLKNRTEKEQVFYCFNRGLPKAIWCVN